MKKDFVKQFPELHIPVKIGDTSQLTYTLWQMEKLLGLVQEHCVAKSTIKKFL